MVVENYCHITYVCQVGRQLDGKLITESVPAITDLQDSSYEYTRRKYIAETACLHGIAHLEIGMARHIVQCGSQYVTSLPVQVAEIVVAPETA